jgi:phospholipid-transporting ATPase
MEYYAATIGGKKYFLNSKEDNVTTDRGSTIDSSNHIDLFYTLINVCHTVVAEKKEDGTLTYNAASPDERALIEGSAKYGFRFLDRDATSVLIEVPGQKQERYQVLNVIEFTSARKRMSVIVKCPDETIKLFIKGADAMIMSLIGKNKDQQNYFKDTEDHLHDFAVEGFRTLSLAYRTITQDEYNDWEKQFHEANVAIENKEEKLDEVGKMMERNLTLLGATAIEDKLQDGVPDTIADLLKANIRVWVLTGDKQETAINIGIACKLLKRDSKMIILNTNSLAETKEKVAKETKELERSVYIISKIIMF